MIILNKGNKRQRGNQPQPQVIFRAERVTRAEPLPNQDLHLLLQDQSGKYLSIVVKLEALHQFLTKVAEGVNRCVDVRKHQIDSNLRSRREDVG